MKNILAILLESQLENFAKEFTSTSKTVFYDEENKKLIHSGEFGMLREACVRELLSNFLPNIYGVAQGYIIGQNDEISHQCDLIIYHKNYTPYLHTPEEQRFFPIESVIAVGEVKSKMSASILDDALEKLTKIKIMKESISSAAIAKCRENVQRKFNPEKNLRDQLVTFLIGEKIDCTNELVATKMKKSWNLSLPRHRINMLISINGGTYVYKDKNNRPWMYSTSPQGEELTIRLDMPQEGKYGHLALFIRYLLMLVEDNTVLYPEFTNHLSVLLKNTSIDLL